MRGTRHGDGRQPRGKDRHELGKELGNSLCRLAVVARRSCCVVRAQAIDCARGDLLGGRKLNHEELLAAFLNADGIVSIG
jgi:hypothetical protein